MQLINTTLDNSLASSWVAANNETLLNTSFIDNEDVSIYPNPTSHIVTIRSKNQISKINVFDVLGSIILSANSNSYSFSIDFSSYSKGIYFVTILDEFGLRTKKIVKQ
ncbi:T9SS type A sorting domain-containing protein [Flavobacterium myungsuense]|uniref:T9SS type A sorting domain-containing protein n=1 Tax=Flavobacterium myungsuense TaxID=651823 RepID=UPI003634AE38